MFNHRSILELFGLPRTERLQAAAPLASGNAPPASDDTPVADGPTMRLTSNGVCRAEAIVDTVPPAFSFWQPSVEPHSWRVGRWYVRSKSPCAHCGYDRRGLPFGGRCPECGSPLAPYLRLHVGSAMGRTPGEMAALRRWIARIRLVGETVGCRPNAVLFVRNAISYGLITRARLGVTAEMAAADVAHSIAEFSPLHFGSVDRAIVGLSNLGLNRSEDVGKAVFGLVDQKLLTASGHDRCEQFDGMFTLRTLFDGR